MNDFTTFKLVSLIIISLVIALPCRAQTECPSGLTQDPAPGQCGLYTDTNEDHNCDLALEADQKTNSATKELDTSNDTTQVTNSKTETAPHQCTETTADPSQGDLISGANLKTKTVAEIATLYDIDVVAYAEALAKRYDTRVDGATKMLLLHDNYGMESKVAKAMALELKNTSTDPFASPAKANTKSKPRYLLIPSSIILLLAYFVGHILTKRKVISLMTHRRIWNVLLLFSFLATGLLGLLLVIRLNWGWSLPLPFNMLYWHVETGIVMAIITIFHTIWHWNYYRAILKRKS